MLRAEELQLIPEEQSGSRKNRRYVLTVLEFFGNQDYL